MSNPHHIIIIAGEASGDMHAAHLVEALKAQNPNLTFSGLGGPQMAKAGMELYQDLTKISVVGFFEVLKHFAEFKRLFHLILAKIREIQPAAVILVDYPGFNLRLAQAVKKTTDTKVIYYISPQVWAWKESRVKLIKKYTDRMLVLFPFEKDFYAKHGLDVTFVGHPLLDTLKVRTDRQELLRSLHLSVEKLTIGLLPGSRKKEIQHLLPAMLEASQILHKEFPKTQFLLMKAPTVDENLLQSYLKDNSLPLKIVTDATYDGINASDLCLVTSGTATFETTLLQKPMVVVYKTSFFSWILAKWLIKIPYIAMANVMIGKKIIPECIQYDANGSKIAQELKNIFTDEVRIAEMKSELKKVRESLGEGGASARAAREILKIL